MLEDILKDINKEFKQELAVKGIGEFVIKRIPFTSPRLNYETYGGIPRGRETGCSQTSRARSCPCPYAGS